MPLWRAPYYFTHLAGISISISSRNNPKVQSSSFGVTEFMWAGMVSVQQVYRQGLGVVCLWHHHLELGTKQANEHYLHIIWNPWQIPIISHHNNSPSDAIPSAPAPSADHSLKTNMAAARTPPLPYNRAHTSSKLRLAGYQLRLPQKEVLKANQEQGCVTDT